MLEYHPIIIHEASTELTMKSRSHTKPLITAAALAALIPTLAMGPELKRELSANRDAMTELETKPLDTSALEALTDWTHPGILSQANTEGKVVLLAMISSGEPKSYMTISKLNRALRDYEDDIVVAAIHPDAGWDEIQSKINSGHVTVPVARDEGGTFAAAMLTDDYPDVYVIDRAGNLRFADLDERSLKNALKQLIAETPESAIANAQRQAEGLEPEDAQALASVDPKAYESAPWPNHNGGKMSANNYQGQPLPVPMGNEEWIYGERDLTGKVLVLDFWATWCGPCIRAMPMLHDLQDDYTGRLEIVGIGGSEDKKDFVRYVMKKKGNYGQMFDESRTLNQALGIKGIPHVLVVSTDGVIRWQGNPHDPNFKTAVAQTIAADPLLAAQN
jgi:cytochrome c biogenesis protein CcmG, thiol:disulfide interchange protein DsbE